MTSLQTASLEEMRQVAARICRDYLTGRWKTVTADQIIVKRISGGLSNFLYYVSLPSASELPTNAIGSAIGGGINTGNNTAVPSLGNVDKNSNEHQNLHQQQHRLVACLDIGGGIDASSCAVDNTTVSNYKRLRTDSDGELMSSTSASTSTTTSTSTSTGGLCHAGIGGLGGGVSVEPTKEPQEVLLRIYGQTHGEHALESIITETVVFALLSERNFGPKLHGLFPGGRIEQYIPARSLTTIELSDSRISMKIASKMGEIHSLNIPMSKEPDWLWNCMERWLQSIISILNQPESCRKIENQAQWDFVQKFDFAGQIKWMKSIIEQDDYTVVFCHNDLQEGNVLLLENTTSSQQSGEMLESSSLNSSSFTFEESGFDDNTDNANMDIEESTSMNNNPMYLPDLESTRDSALSNHSHCRVGDTACPDLIIIDFEYCAYNYRGFDLANHFLEWTYDYSNQQFPFYFHFKHQYPTRQQREDFIVTYLKKLNEHIFGYVPTAAEVARLEREVQIFSMISHLFWSMWSVVNTTSNIEFGYWEYAVSRIREYQLYKEQFKSGNISSFNEDPTTMSSSLSSNLKIQDFLQE